MPFDPADHHVHLVSNGVRWSKQSIFDEENITHIIRTLLRNPRKHCSTGSIWHG